MSLKRGFVATALLVASALGGMGLLVSCDDFRVELPPTTAVARAIWAEQGWSAEERHRFHHTSQGTASIPIPYEWFIALEQPLMTLSEAPLLRDATYLSRFGLIPSPKDDKLNPHGLPVGLARDPDFRDPTSGERFTALGLTCAACHTGHIEYRGTSIRIDGGPAMADFGALSKAVGLSVLFTRWIPGRLGRFLDRVSSDPVEQDEIENAFKAFVGQLMELVKVEKQLAQVDEGFGRLDALTRIGNELFGRQLGIRDNYAPITAPVAFPHIWGASWLDWIQYNGSIKQPMFRNVGEALGVMARVNLKGSAGRFDTTARLQDLHALESLLAGPEPPQAQKRFTGLRSPKWPEDVLGKIDRRAAAHGAELYVELCKGCHGPAPDTAEFWNDAYWTPEQAGARYWKVKMLDVSDVGTDPGQAKAMAERRVQTPADLGIEEDSFAGALRTVVENVMSRWYAKAGISSDVQERMNGHRPIMPRAPMQYRTRPLDGIWATPPFLHNGSVPNLYALLSPVEERPKTFYLGSREFDPERVGYRAEPLEGGFVMDTTIPGNSNAGHEFRDGELGRGVIGRHLKPDERRALVEYLKTL